MYRFFILQLMGLLLTAGPIEAEKSQLASGAEGKSLFQSIQTGPVKVLPETISLDLQTASDEELLAESEETVEEASLLEGGELKQAGRASKSSEAPVEGLALLLQDLRWLFGIVTSVAVWLASYLQVIYADILTWATAFVSFSLTRSILVPILCPKVQKAAEPECDEAEEGEDEVEDDEVEQDEEEVASPQTELQSSKAEALEKQKAAEQEDELAKRKRALQHVQKDDRDVFGCTALHLAAHNGFAEDVQQLLSMGFSPNWKDKASKETPLHMAARAGCLETTRLLLDGKADPCVRNSFGHTPFAIAMHANEAVAQLLRERSRKVD
eukprot:TRINITY_DN2958_c0_g1_i1.p1 TRINITY_DN2958_c0_g1~~TRINITY_DN2958_c0_g1_i1.p1  ORF type:complete len:326 (-),score=106.71 TRINITY_DN2958_c0_g1_i1:179-1156(-)